MITGRGLLKSAIATATVRIAKEEDEAMDQRISIVTLRDKSLAASWRSYANGLGWKRGLRKTRRSSSSRPAG
jgi:hypothetical protein